MPRPVSSVFPLVSGPGAFNGTQGPAGPPGAPGGVLIPPVTLSGAANTLALSHQGKYVQVSHNAPSTLTVPPNSSVPFPVGAVVYIVQIGTGAVTLAQGVGVTIRKAETLTLRKTDSSGMIVQTAIDVWEFTGDMILA